MNINLHIERLVLDGISVEPNKQLALEAATTSELGRLLTAEGVGPCMRSGGSIRTIRGGTISVRENLEPTKLGQQIAQAVYGGCGR